MVLTRRESRLERRDSRLARNEMRGGNLLLSGTVNQYQSSSQWFDILELESL